MSENLLGEYITEKRRESNMSLRNIAEKAQISPSQLSKIERGIVKSPTEETLVKIAYALNEDKNDILALAGRVSQDEIKDRWLLSPFNNEVAASIEDMVSLDWPTETHIRKEDAGIDGKRLELFARITQALQTTYPDLDHMELFLLTKEMVAAYDLTLKRFSVKINVRDIK
ncbi:helix-turn-helix domain-containing protein [Paenibacillus odorifer]|uniref:HTH cro/C1-type domain-containing protein n=1 Tax=Paenibacillus odorifer TaxID=189426 RepID=A0A1R0X2W1_9BACL|nr:helix-turn-helix transcriptional regulator [Paenibacillus odorifer]OMD27455.1 hypothetical protein BJP51_24990 [Paenibacillus odorifer]